jgi:hypothetical protein
VIARHRRRTSKIKAIVGGMILLMVALFVILIPAWIYLGMH